MPVDSMEAIHACDAATIHAEALEGDFLPGLGIPFLQVFYQSILQDPSTHGFVYTDGDRSSGFVVGTTDSESLFRKTYTRSAFQLGWAALPAVVRDPGLQKKIIETFFYPSRDSAVPDKGELLVIAVKESQRSQGIGSQLVEALNNHFIKLGVRSYKVSVLKSREAAMRFYLREGFETAASFQLYQKTFMILRKHLSP